MKYLRWAPFYASLLLAATVILQAAKVDTWNILTGSAAWAGLRLRHRVGRAADGGPAPAGRMVREGSLFAQGRLSRAEAGQAGLGR